MSSHPLPTACDAVVIRSEKTIGPFRLPDEGRDEFIDQFNRIYAGCGLKLERAVIDAEQSESNYAETTGDARANNAID